MKIDTFTLMSSDLGGNATTSQAYGDSGGDNISPELEWTNPPQNTKSFAITMYDESAPTGGGFWHWIIFNIPANVTHLPAGSGNFSRKLLDFDAIQSINDFGFYGYGGMNPPKGDCAHLYIITIYALNVASLKLNRDSMPNFVGFELWKHTISKASIVTYFGLS